MFAVVLYYNQKERETQMNIIYTIVIGDLRGQHQTLYYRNRNEAAGRAAELKRKGYKAQAYQVAQDLVRQTTTHTPIG